jgi:hypothetical protein
MFVTPNRKTLVSALESRQLTKKRKHARCCIASFEFAANSISIGRIWLEAVMEDVGNSATEVISLE